MEIDWFSNFRFLSVGHAGAMLQARRIGNELFVGVHSDEAILEHKGPTVMTLKERLVCQTNFAMFPYYPRSIFLRGLTSTPLSISPYLAWPQ